MFRNPIQFFGKSLFFTTNYRVDITTLITQTDNVSYGAWFATNSPTTQRQCIFYTGVSSTNGYGVFVNRDNATYGLYILFGGIAWTPLMLGTLNTNFNHIVVTRDTTTVRAYLNSKLIYTGTPAAPITPTTNTRIGNDPSSASFFQGNLDNSFHYPRVLTQAEISQIYENGVFAATPSFLYRYNEGSGSTATDASGNGNNGIITNATYSSLVPTQFNRTVSTDRFTSTDRLSAVGRQAVI